MPNRALMAQTMVQLADTLVSDFDLVEVLTGLAHRCVEALGVSAAGVMIASPAGELQAIASSSETMRVLELFELQSHEGPCLDCYATGTAVSYQSLDAAEQWPRFAPKAIEAGFSAVQALPMRLRETTIGALNLFHLERGAMRDVDLVIAQAFADIATIAILQHRTATEKQELNNQLNNALTTRIVIEQAKGMLAVRGSVDMEHAFNSLRNYARTNNLKLAQVCVDLVNGRLAASALDQRRGSRAVRTGVDRR